jgi:hypothetical protein
MHCLRVAASVVLSGYFIGSAMNPTETWLLVAFSALVGAVLVIATTTGVFVGGALIAWGLAGAVLAIGLANWKQQRTLRRVYVVYVGLAFVFTMLAFDPLGYVQLGVCVISLAATSVWLRARTKPASVR